MMKPSKRVINIIIFIVLLVTIIVFWPKKSFISHAEEISYIYFDLAAGNVTINGSTYTGYVFKTENGVTTTQTITGSHTDTNNYYVYQSNETNKTSTGLQTDGNYILPQYERIKHPTNTLKAWGEYITNNTNVVEVTENWDNMAESVGRTASPGIEEDGVTKHYRIILSGGGNYSVTIDNVWSGYQNDVEILSGTPGIHTRTTGGISYTPEATSGKATIYLKGDNRFGNIHYNAKAKEEEQFIFENGENTDSIPGTVTVCNLGGDTGYNHFDSVIGGSNHNGKVTGCVINSGIIYAGATQRDNCTAIGGGGCSYGCVTINGGTVTAITASNGTAIGGGIGDGGAGGEGKITINGGEVYAYNLGLAISGTRYPVNDSSTEEEKKLIDVCIPAVAIGSGSSRRSTTVKATVQISGGNVWATSVGGTAIGGGSSVNYMGADADINITGGNVVAKSIAGTVDTIYEKDGGIPTYADKKVEVAAGTSMGGGTAGIPFLYSNTTTKVLLPFGSGGNATVTISGDNTVVTAGSIGGGKTSDTSENPTGKIGSATVNINSGTIYGQVIMASGTSDESTSSFNMTGGVIDNGAQSDEFTFLKENGGAVFLESGVATISGGTIKNCSALQGGAIYVNGGDFELSGTGEIIDCEALDGGAVYVSGGNVTIDDGTINNCKASKGGGIYIANGDITMNGGTISNNQATEHGGGIYASSDTQNLNVTITSGSIVRNIANGHGGGVGVNMGQGLSAKVIIGLEDCNGLDETHNHPIILDNTANEKGGGFCLHGDSLDMTMYCGSINGNIAIREPGSSNINQTGGSVTVYGGTVSGGITIIGGKYTYVPADVSKVGVTYNSNIINNSQIEQAEITPGVVISLPRTLFTREGYTLVGWSASQSPGATDTVYEAGELYTVPEESIILYAIWLRDGAGSIEAPAIISGKIYEEFSGAVNLMISSDSAFTAIMSVLDIKPNLYNNRTLSFSNNLKKGTTIVMIDLTNENERGYYYYKVDNDTTMSIPLESFIQMGGEQEANYKNPTTGDSVDEKFLFIVDLSDDNTETHPTQMKLTRYSADNEIAQIDQTVSFTTTTQRSFDFTWTNKPSLGEKLMLGDTFSLAYDKNNPAGEDSRYAGRKVTLVIVNSGDTPILQEAKLYDGTNYYELNSNEQFVIPLGSVTESRNISLQLISKSLLANEQECNLKAELWVSANDDETSPFMGDKVATLDNILFTAIPLPALKVNINKRLYRTNNFDGNIEVNYNSQSIDGYNVTLEIQKKNEEGIYETQVDMLSSVSDEVSNAEGVFSLKINGNGKLKLKFIENWVVETGTYRVLIKVMDGNEAKFTIPYNFMILD